MLPTVDFCGIEVTRLVIGANPFGGYSHQSAERDREMREYYTIERIKQTWARAEAAGINTMVTNNETPHVLQAVREYLDEGGSLQWIAQVNSRSEPDMAVAVEEAVAIGCKAIYFHGAQVDDLYSRKDGRTLGKWCDTARSQGIPVGVAGHSPRVHRWVNSMDIVDFHAVCFFTCGSLHDGKGHTFRLGDVAPAAEATRAIDKPCIAYKIMGAGRIDAAMALEFALTSIKPTDVVNVGMHRGDKDDMVEENAATVCEVLNSHSDGAEPPGGES
ncbi:hypothetical protein LCGC14_1153430 [marine sediment metagenome]|uniref:Xylose isomerase-like TIM barrel domain-containing protein n=1 Tax=marine sediment metagenome TaxID=412755 RepID=A0A0F9LUS7_9ZZZZ